jgi:hypothetical protein
MLSLGENVTLRVDVPGGSTVPAAGEYENVPGTFAVAFSCKLLSALPNTTSSANDSYTAVGNSQGTPVKHRFFKFLNASASSLASNIKSSDGGGSSWRHSETC